ncbi:dTMP kinase [Oceanicaulis sp. LC35]|uniref:dTMP kinase n=1 Tax=Oceanicaulis sp. LC35 TaxID=3349635 RepID=UPI003F869C36
MTRGCFITLEGGEGAGKTTLAKALSAALEAQGVKTLITREPGGTTNAEALRNLLVEGETDRWSPLSETLLLYAARVDHVERLIKPSLEQGVWVICDRFSDSTRAYQGAAGGLSSSQIEEIDRACMHGFGPDLTFVVDLDPEIGLERTRQRGEGATRFERKPAAFHHALRVAFLDIARETPDRCVVLDGAMPADKVADTAFEMLSQRLGAFQ